MIDSFNSRAVSKIVGIPPRVIDYWDRTNFIKPSVSEASGHGSVRLFSFSDLIQFKVAKLLRGKGLSLQKIRKSLHYLRKHLPEIERPLAQLRFLTDGETIFVLTNNDRKMIDTLKKGQYILTIAIEPLIKDLVGKTSRASTERGYLVTVSKRRFKVVVHPDLESGGYWVECPELPGCSSQGDSLEEALDMIKDAIKGHLALEGEERRNTASKRRAA